MPLPDSGPREAMHHRAIDMQGYRRADGWFEIEGRIDSCHAFARDGVLVARVWPMVAVKPAQGGVNPSTPPSPRR